MLATIPEPKIQLSPAVRRAWIRLRLAERGLTLKALARRSRTSYGSIRQAMVHRKPKAERVIARAIGIAPESIWPERYQEASTSKVLRIRGLTARGSN